jgi:hypothetical protein
MRSPIRKSIAIIGEGETEWFYFDTLRVFHRYPFKMAPDFPSHSDIGHILNLAERYVREKYDYIVCLIDMDRLRQTPAEWNKYKANKEKRIYKNVTFIETYPCTEFWFLLHFLPTLSTKTYHSCEELLPELRRYMPGYEKTKRYFRRNNLYCFLMKNGDIQNAIRNAERLCEIANETPEDMLTYSEIYKVINLLTQLSL